MTQHPTTGDQSTGGRPQRERCEVCLRAIAERTPANKRRCADHHNVIPLFPLTDVRRRRHEPANPNTANEEGGPR